MFRAMLNKMKHQLCGLISQKLKNSKIKQKIIMIELSELYSKICLFYIIGRVLD